MNIRKFEKTAWCCCSVRREIEKKRRGERGAGRRGIGGVSGADRVSLLGGGKSRGEGGKRRGR